MSEKIMCPLFSRWIEDWYENGLRQDLGYFQIILCNDGHPKDEHSNCATEAVCAYWQNGRCALLPKDDSVWKERALKGKDFVERLWPVITANLRFQFPKLIESTSKLRKEMEGWK